MIKTARQLHEGESCPSWYGFTYRDYVRSEIVCHPIPINFLVRWYRHVKFKVKFPEESDVENRMREIWREGVAEGQRREREYTLMFLGATWKNTEGK